MLGSWDLGAVSHSQAHVSQESGAQAPWTWQVGGQNCPYSASLPSPQVKPPPCCPRILSSWISAASASSSGALSLPSCQDLMFPVYPFPSTPSSGPRKCQHASWEHGPPAGGQAALSSFVFGSALPISLCSAHMPGANREAGQGLAR